MYVLWDGLDILYGTVTEYSIMIMDRKSTQYHDCENLRIKASMLICSNFCHACTIILCDRIWEKGLHWAKSDSLLIFMKQSLSTPSLLIRVFRALNGVNECYINEFENVIKSPLQKCNKFWAWEHCWYAPCCRIIHAHVQQIVHGTSMVVSWHGITSSSQLFNDSDIANQYSSTGWRKTLITYKKLVQINIVKYPKVL